jgi:HAE1 family hydrophobic/amphiphilic exporter-1
MTSLAFILSIVPLVIATGAGSHARNSLGTVVFFGMILSSVLNLYVIPVLYVFVVRLFSRKESDRPLRPIPALRALLANGRRGNGKHETQEEPVTAERGS